jgi:hypothetical protein
MKYILRISLVLALVTLLGGCGHRLEETEKHNSIYYWKTTFDISPTEMEFLKKHDIERLYVRMFDVAVEQNPLSENKEVVPIATTKFVSEVPSNLEIVPVTYITIDALRAMEGEEYDFATLIVERLLAMSSYNNCGEIKEIQLDCDWTSTTKSSYIRLCQRVKDLLHFKGIDLSITIRLHQLQEAAPPADRGVLMLYNTGALKNPDTTNSILNINDVKPYIKSKKYSLPLNYAYPTFGWGVKFVNGKFVSIVSEESRPTSKEERIRHERPTSIEILDVKRLVESKLGKPERGNIIYHLDDSQLKNYTDDEIAKILSY